MYRLIILARPLTGFAAPLAEQLCLCGGQFLCSGPAAAIFFAILIILLMRGSLNAQPFFFANYSNSKFFNLTVLIEFRFWVSTSAPRCRKLTLIKKIGVRPEYFWSTFYQCDQCLFKIWPAIFLSSKRDICAHVYNLRHLFPYAL